MQSDCYSLGMVIYEVLSGQAPFAPHKGSIVIRKVLEGERPARPQGDRGKLFTDAIWGLLELCWKPLPDNRISVGAVLQGLERKPPRLGPGPVAGGSREPKEKLEVLIRAPSKDHSDPITEGNEAKGA